jgi:HSP20 family molecular chaperone IbpA
MDRNQYLNLLSSVDVMNTLNGGRTEPRIQLKQHDGFREIRVKIPGIAPEKIEVEVNNNRVSIFYEMNIVSGDKVIVLPYSVYNKEQPYFIDVSKIIAEIENDELVVRLPFNRLANGYHRKIRTRKD